MFLSDMLFSPIMQNETNRPTGMFGFALVWLGQIVSITRNTESILPDHESYYVVTRAGGPVGRVENLPYILILLRPLRFSLLWESLLD